MAREREPRKVIRYAVSVSFPVDSAYREEPTPEEIREGFLKAIAEIDSTLMTAEAYDVITDLTEEKEGRR